MADQMHYRITNAHYSVFPINIKSNIEEPFDSGSLFFLTLLKISQPPIFMCSLVLSKPKAWFIHRYYYEQPN